MSESSKFNDWKVKSDGLTQGTPDCIGVTELAVRAQKHTSTPNALASFEVQRK